MEMTEMNGNIHLQNQVDISRTTIARHVRFILYWENVLTSVITLFTLLMVLLTFSLYPGIHATLLVLIGGYGVSLTFILCFLLYCVAAGKEPYNPFKNWLTNFNLDRDWILNQLSVLLDSLTPRVISVLKLVFFLNPRDSITGFVILWIMSYFTPYISLLELAYIAVFTLFTVPKSYEVYQVKIDNIINKVLQQISDVQKRVTGTEEPNQKNE